MCGICGVFYRDPHRPVDEPALRGMRDTLAHRGPDGAGLWIEGPFGFGHRRLSIIDLEGGAQPIWNEDRSVGAILNGEIYNYIELRDELIARGHSFRTRCDAETVVHLYEEKGERFVEDLNGMFAIALWDCRSKTLWLTRDRLGIKPLYLLEDDAGIRFASEIKALLAFERRRGEIDPRGLADYLTFQYTLGEKTLFKGIRSLSPGTILRVDRAGSRQRTYWSIPMEETDPAIRPETAAEQLLALLSDSVKLQLRSDVPVGCHLSGGIDTAAIAALARRQTGKPLQSFTAAFEEGGIYDDRAYARISAQAAGTDHQEILPGPADFADKFQRLIWFMDQPAAGPGLFPQFFVSRLAKQKVTVVLGGQGADEILGGYTRYYLWALEQHAMQQATGSPIHSTLTLQELLPGLSQLKNYMPLLRSFLKEDTGSADFASRYFLLIRRQSNLETLLHPDLLKTLDGYDPFTNYLEIFNRHPKADLLNRVLYFETTAWLPALLQVEDRMSMACSLESRVPFLDHRIVEWAFRLPASVKLAGGKTKAVLRQAARGLVADPILDRTDKIGFPVPLGRWFEGPLKPFLEEFLSENRLAKRGVLRPEASANWKSDGSLEQRAVWGNLCLEAWMRTFIDSDGPEIRTGPSADRKTSSSLEPALP